MSATLNFWPLRLCWSQEQGAFLADHGQGACFWVQAAEPTWELFWGWWKHRAGCKEEKVPALLCGSACRGGWGLVPGSSLATPRASPNPGEGARDPSLGSTARSTSYRITFYSSGEQSFHLNNSMFSVGFASYLEGSVFSYIIAPSSRGTLNSRVLVCPTMLLIRWVVLNCKHFKA